MPFQQCHIYPLKDAALFDDDFGEGFDHTFLADRGPIAPGVWVHDSWIVKADGQVHPGLNVTPVPVRLEHVYETSGRPFPQGHT